ncbi:hypothetical protein DL770_006242 [Monosporascus sp. CRB-9-2]|nr:hypothetical protein DL770_006242 [Monosporascus sp. CRB-9-2]
MYTPWAPDFRFEFSMVVYNEAYLLKNKNSSTHKVVKSIRPDALTKPVPEGFFYTSLYGERVKKPASQPFEDFARTGFFAKSLKNISRSKPLVYEGCLRYEDLRDAAENGRHPWLINPCNFNLTLKEFGYDFAACRMIFMPALNELLVKRGMESSLILPWGTTVTPDEDIPGAAFRIARVHFPPAGQAKAKSRLNPSAWRHCGLPAVNMLNEALLTTRVENTGLSDAGPPVASDGDPETVLAYLLLSPAPAVAEELRKWRWRTDSYYKRLFDQLNLVEGNHYTLVKGEVIIFMDCDGEVLANSSEEADTLKIFEEFVIDDNGNWHATTGQKGSLSRAPPVLNLRESERKIFEEENKDFEA